jgi:hypothetical protein
MLHAAPFLLALTAAAAPGANPLAGVCSAAQHASVTMAQTVKLLDAELVLGADESLLGINATTGVARPTGRVLPSLQPNRLRLGLPRLQLGWLSVNAVSISVSISFLAGTGCGSDWAWSYQPALDLTEVVPVPSATVAIRYRPAVSLSVLAPWQTLITRLGEKGSAHASVSVGVGMASGVMMAGRQGAVGQPGGTGVSTPSVGGQPWSAPTLRPPTLSFPGVSRPTVSTVRR